MTFAFYQGSPISYVSGSVSLHFEPGWLHQSHPMILRRGAKPYDSLVAYCRERKPMKVCVLRTYALGDVLMLLPVLRAMRRLLSLPKPVILATGSQAFRGLGGLIGDPDVRMVKAMGVRDYGADIHMDLEGCLEPDHRGGPESDLHRMELYGRVLGLC